MSMVMAKVFGNKVDRAYGHGQSARNICTKVPGASVPRIFFLLS